MRLDDDFAAYTAARWPVVVRVLALLGCPDELLTEVAVDGLARCRPGWAATVRRGETDVAVMAGVLAAWTERRRTPWWEGLAGPDPDSERARAGVVLDVLPGWSRSALVLHEAGGLDPAQVAAALDVDEGAVHAALDDTRIRPGVLEVAAASVDVLAPPIDAVARRSAARARRRRQRVAAVVAAGVVLAGTTTAVAWTARDGSPAPEPPAAGTVRREANPVDAVWFASGELHLRGATVEVPRVLHLVEVEGGAVFVDQDSRVSRIDEQGEQTYLGRADPIQGVVGSVDGAWVAWRDQISGDLVVHDVARGEEVRRVGGLLAEPVSIDDGRLYYNSLSGAYAVRLPDGQPRRIARQPLLDVRAGTRLFQADTVHVRLSRPGLDARTGRGAGGRLSDDGRLALTTVRGRPVVYDVLGGTADPGLRPGDVAVAAQLGRDGTIVLVVVPADQPEPADPTFGRLSSSGSWELRTCVLGTGDCELRGRIPAAGSIPLFAG
jgi:hypothetical protein